MAGLTSQISGLAGGLDILGEALDGVSRSLTGAGSAASGAASGVGIALSQTGPEMLNKGPGGSLPVLNRVAPNATMIPTLPGGDPQIDTMARASTEQVELLKSIALSLRRQEMRDPTLDARAAGLL